jgi:uncharacterized C2H2 Zn-finger protein
MFPTRELWEDHEFGRHRVNRYWSCSTCQHKAKTPEDWRKHLEHTHGLPLSDDQYLITTPSAEVRDSVPIELENCPLCQEIPGKSRRDFVIHVGKHMEAIALAALPREEEECLDSESMASSTSSLTSTGKGKDEIKPHGGLTKNGRPAELVRVKRATGNGIGEDSFDSFTSKEFLFKEAEEDKGILRAKPGHETVEAKLAPKRCREPGCGKEFRRQCDITKHEKIHSRPWKCPVETCKYNEYGWPTEKELDRHHNDKHSSVPPLYECYFKPCPYRSKREANCKKHMEKAHGWTYLRSKRKGQKNAATGALGQHDQMDDNPLDLQNNSPDYGLPDIAQKLPEYDSLLGDNIFQRGFETSGAGYASKAVPHLSSVGHTYTPTSLLEDEGFEDSIPSNRQMGAADFQLFPSSTGGAVASSVPSAPFEDILSSANINYPGVPAQELLDFYAASTAAATAGHPNGSMDWTEFAHFERQ